MKEAISLNKTIVPWIARTGKMIESFLNAAFQEQSLDLTTKQWVLLKVLVDNDGDIQNNLAKMTNRNKGSITRLIATMEDKNLVARIPDPEDQRLNRIYVTKNGHQIFKDSNPIIIESFNQLQEGIGQDEVELLIEILKKVQNNIGGNY